MTTKSKFKAGLVQTRTGRDVDANLVATTALIREAVKGGAQYVQTPEMTNIMELERDRLLTWTKPEDGNPAIAHFQALARELGIWLHIGSMAVKVAETKLANRGYLFSPKGAITAKYDKIHMFDVDLPSGESYRESRRYVAGDKAVVAPLPWGNLGITICYDMRFPGLYRTLAKAGADFLAMPSAFTVPTGKAHWHTLLRARAIEAQCFVLAAAQGGKHDNGRETYGHSLVVSPWGEVLAEGGTEPGVIFADIDSAKVTEARSRVPSLEHDRPYSIATVAAEAPTAPGTDTKVRHAS
jgi:deaminated glutathione amidase